ncbi:hypothetical protein OROGR_007390 [Orobanche gracilis]
MKAPKEYENSSSLLVTHIHGYQTGSERGNGKMAAEYNNEAAESVKSTDTENKKTKKKKGMLSKIWDALFRVHGDNFEKRLQHICKEEAAVVARVTRRSHSIRRITRHFIVFSVLFEGYCSGLCYHDHQIVELELENEGIASLTNVSATSTMFHYLFNTSKLFKDARCFEYYLGGYTSVDSFTCSQNRFTGDRKDHKILEKLRAERQAKIDELKEKTNYYSTQQLIQVQRYDTDPAAKAAAATVLASKLGADSGLKVHVSDDSNPNAPTGKSNDVEIAPITGLRHRKQPHSKTSGTESESGHHPEEGMLSPAGFEGAEVSQKRQLVVEHHPQTGLSSNGGGWIARLAALLVGDDPAQSYALICGNCHMHNGLARKEDFPYVTYYCPHCNALNRPKQSDDRFGSDSPTAYNAAVLTSLGGGSTGEEVSPNTSPADGC